ncbi:MAG: SgcJ/EcaC family oxidoreductase [Acidobacteriota bacterium]|nr:SgcJ/EcaC family oxidoreductase [Acidobacteriota bacterium]
MKFTIVIIVLLTVIASSVFAQETPVKIEGKHKIKDEAAIQKVVAYAWNGWSKGEPDQAVTEYTNDAYWLNAFGIEKHGKAEIKTFLTDILARPGFRAGRSQIPTHIVLIRFIRPDVASVQTYSESIGQIDKNGKPVGQRKPYIFRIMTKLKGKWLTESFRVMDVRQ